jgi:hypothetical protein
MKRTPKITAGWREWIALPNLGIPAVKAKLDTGARTSALHAENIQVFTENGVQRVRFLVHPVQRDTSVAVPCVADVADRRRITDSGGHAEHRIIIETQLAVDGAVWPIKLSLTNRDPMRFRMLLGRTAMRGHMVVDPGRSFVTGMQLESAYGARPKKPGKRI